jgi:hypothetical protein
VVAARLADGRDDRLGPLEQVAAVAAGELLVLQERGRGQDDVGDVAGVGPALLVHDDEHVVAGERAADAVLVGGGGDGVGVVDPHDPHGRVGQLLDGATDLREVDHAGGGRGQADARLVGAVPARRRHTPAAAAHAHLAVDGGQADDGADGVGAVAGALDAPAAAQQGGRGGGVALGQLLDLRGRDVAGRGGGDGGPGGDGLLPRGGVGGVGGEEGAVGPAAGEGEVVDGHRQRDVGAGERGEVEGGLGGERGAARVDDDQLAAAGQHVAGERDEVDARGAGVDAPQREAGGVGGVGRIGAGEVAVHGADGGAGVGGAPGAVDAGGAEHGPQALVEAAAGDVAVGAAVPARQDGLAAVRGEGCAHPVGDEGHRFVPRRADEAVAPADHRVEHPLGAVDAAVEAGDLAADPAGREAVLVAAADAAHAAILDGDGEAAPVGAVERTDGRVGAEHGAERRGTGTRGA